MQKAIVADVASAIDSKWHNLEDELCVGCSYAPSSSPSSTGFTAERLSPTSIGAVASPAFTVPLEIAATLATSLDSSMSESASDADGDSDCGGGGCGGEGVD